MTQGELDKKVKKEVGFEIFPLTYSKAHIYSGKDGVFDLEGHFLRLATAADITKWNRIRKRLTDEAKKQPKK